MEGREYKYKKKYGEEKEKRKSQGLATQPARE